MSGFFTSSDGRRVKERGCGWLQDSKAAGQRPTASGKWKPAVCRAARCCQRVRLPKVLEGTTQCESDGISTFGLVLAAARLPIAFQISIVCLQVRPLSASARLALTHSSPCLDLSLEVWPCTGAIHMRETVRLVPVF